MRTIQEVGLEILGNKPKPMYFFCGPEIGIKQRYIDILQQYYGKLVEAQSLSDVLQMMRTKHIIPLQPAVYVVRYDDIYLSQLSASSAKYIAGTKIVGTIVGIYEGDKAAAKLAKYAGDYTVSIDNIDAKYIEKYLTNEFSGLANRYIQIAATCGENYSHARNICRSLSMCSKSLLSNLSDSELVKLFGIGDTATENQFKLGIASRDYKYVCDLLDIYDGDPNDVFYYILSTLIELEKCASTRSKTSSIAAYLDRWPLSDICQMFAHVYTSLKLSRKISIGDPKLVVLYLFSLLPYSPIPPEGSL